MLRWVSWELLSKGWFKLTFNDLIQGFKDGVEFVAMIDVGGLPITLCVPEDDVKDL